MKRLIIMSLVIMSVASQAMASTYSTEKQKIVANMSNEMDISQPHANSLYDEVVDFHHQLSPAKQEVCKGKSHQFIGEEQVFIDLLNAGSTTFARYVLINLKQSFRELGDQACLSPTMRQIAQDDLSRFEQYLQDMHEER